MFEINDKEIFNDILFEYSDTIKLSRKTALTINRINNDDIETVFKKVVSETELKDYITEKYPKAWSKMKISHPEIDFTPGEQKLKLFEPKYREIVKILTLNNGKELKTIEYHNDEEIMLMGGTNIECIISKN